MFSLQSDVPGAQYHIANLAACAQLLAPGAAAAASGLPAVGRGPGETPNCLARFFARHARVPAVELGAY